MKLNPYQPPANNARESENLRSPPAAPTHLPRHLKYLALLAILLSISFITLVVIFGDTHKRQLDRIGISVVMIEMAIVAWGLLVIRGLRAKR